MPDRVLDFVLITIEGENPRSLIWWQSLRRSWTTTWSN